MKSDTKGEWTPWAGSDDLGQHARALILIDRAGITPPRDFDGSNMWRALRLAFAQADGLELGRMQPTAADIEKLTKLERVAADLAATIKELVLGNEPPILALLATARDMKGDGGKAAHRIFTSTEPNDADALARVARGARQTLEKYRSVARAVGLKQSGVTPEGLLLGELLPAIFKKYVGQRPTFTPAGRGNGRTSAFFRFAHMAFLEGGRPQMTDDAMLEARKRWLKAARTS